MPRFKRFRKRMLLFGLALALILLSCAGVLTYFVQFQFAGSLEFLVARQSKGRYMLEAGEASISLWKGTIAVKRARLYCRDTANMDAWVDIRIPELYFSMGSSWKTLLFKHKLLVDSMAIVRPDINIRVLRRPSRAREAMAPANILNMLDSTLLRLQVRSFSLQDAAFALVGPGGDPLYGDHISLFVANFGQGRKGELKLALGRQHWVKPGTGMTLDLARLVFDSREQRFEVDSLLFSDHRNSTGTAFGLAAERLYFTSHELPAVYRDGKLLLDSLVGVNPVVSLPAGGKVSGRSAGGAGGDRGSPGDDLVSPGDGVPFFTYIGVRVIQVLNGQLQTRDGSGRTGTASTRKANLRIFGLRIDGSVASAVAADSIGVDLHHLEFLSKDSVHRLTIEEFGLRGNDAVFRQVRFARTHPEPGRTVVFTAPRLVIRDISIPDLLRNHLRARGAALFQPTISIADDISGGGPGNVALRSPANARQRRAKMELFYATLHAVRQLIDAPYLDIVDGRQHFVLGGASPIEVTATGVQAHILLNKLFLSDSLLDIKRALPRWKVEDFELSSRRVRLSALGYELSGGQRSSVCREVRVSMADGWQVEARDVFWNALNWDLLQATGILHMDSLHIGRLVVGSGAWPATGVSGAGSAVQVAELLSTDSGRKTGAPMELRLDKVLVDSIAFERPAADGGVRFTGGKVRLMGLAAGAGGMHWGHAKAALRELFWQKPDITIGIGESELDSDNGAVARNIRVGAAIGRGSLDLRIPFATLGTSIHSIDIRSMPLLSVRVPRAGFLYAATGGNDTLRISGQLQLTVSSGRIFPLLGGAVDVAWDEASGYRRTGDAVYSASELTGSFHDAEFDLASVRKTDWRSWLARMTLRRGRLQYWSKKLTADIRECTWDPAGRTLSLAGFAVAPVLDRDASLKQATWQSDYVTVRGRRLALAGVRFGGEPGHLSVEVPTMILDGVQVEASRDKHIPFQHGTEKAMPTKLLAGLRFDLRVDTVRVLGGKVTYNEWPVTSGRWTTLPIDDIDGELWNIRTRPDDRDTLRVVASGRIIDGRIRWFRYNESYGDSLSGFTARCSFPAFDLTGLSSILVPTASVRVVRGHVDSIWSIWQGNRYAAYGTMGLYYDRLRVSVLNKKDSARRNFLPVVETWAANWLLPSRNKQESPIFFERDREKFVFNYWVKSQASGILSALVRSKGRTYKRRYARVAKKYNLKRPSSQERN